jgi:hypothetical protein
MLYERTARTARRFGVAMRRAITRYGRKEKTYNHACLWIGVERPAGYRGSDNAQPSLLAWRCQLAGAVHRATELGRDRARCGPWNRATYIASHGHGTAITVQAPCDQ